MTAANTGPGPGENHGIVLQVPFYLVLLNPLCMHACMRKPPGFQINTSLLLIICEHNGMKWKMIKMMMLPIAIQPQYRNCWCHLLLKTQNWRASLGADFHAGKLCSAVILNMKFQNPLTRTVEKRESILLQNKTNAWLALNSSYVMLCWTQDSSNG